jgi:hypothetical protein
MFYAQTAKQINQAKYSPHTSEKLAVCEAGANNLNLKNLLFPFWWDDVLFELHTKLRGHAKEFSAY